MELEKLNINLERKQKEKIMFLANKYGYSVSAIIRRLFSIYLAPFEKKLK